MLQFIRLHPEYTIGWSSGHRQYVKAKMIPFDEVEERIGHAPGGVCPFGVREGIQVYLDESLRRFDTVYLAASWVDVCKE